MHQGSVLGGPAPSGTTLSGTRAPGCGVRVRSGCFLMGCRLLPWDAGSLMTTAPTDAPFTYRRATRDTEAPIIGGVAAGLARHLGVPVHLGARRLRRRHRAERPRRRAVRRVVAAAAGRHAFETDTPGAESATRGGRRPGVRRRLGDVGPLIVLATLGLGAILLVQATFGQGAVFWALIIGVVGVGLLWRQADEVAARALVHAGPDGPGPDRLRQRRLGVVRPGVRRRRAGRHRAVHHRLRRRVAAGGAAGAARRRSRRGRVCCSSSARGSSGCPPT